MAVGTSPSTDDGIVSDLWPNCLQRGSANWFRYWPNSKYFRICEPHASVRTIHFGHCTARTAIYQNEWAWPDANTNLFTKTGREQYLAQSI